MVSYTLYRGVREDILLSFAKLRKDYGNKTKWIIFLVLKNIKSLMFCILCFAFGNFKFMLIPKVATKVVF